MTANPDNFTLLSKLLSAPVDVAAKAWDLLMRLPTNPVIQQGISDISAQSEATVQWNSLIDTSSPFRLLYALQIVETLTDVSDIDGDSTVTAVDHVEAKPATTENSAGGAAGGGV